MELNARMLAKLPPLPRGKSEQIFFDDDLPGFGLRLREGGSRMWIFQYKIGAKHRRMTIGNAAVMKPHDARATAGDLHANVRLGKDPAGEKGQARVHAIETFDNLARRFLVNKKATTKPRTYAEVERHILTHAKPLHGLTVSTIDRRTVADLLGNIEENNGPIARNRVRATLADFFSWCVREGFATNNPVIATSRAPETPRARVLTLAELREIWAALNGDQFGAIVRLLTLTLQRRVEVGGLLRSEFDSARRAIVVPAARMKNNREHMVPLSDPAFDILQQQPQIAGREFLFGEGSGGFQGWSKCKERLDARIQAARVERDGKKAKPMPAWTLHDLRRTGRTMLEDVLDVAPHICEAILGHVSSAASGKAGVAGVYNKSKHEAKKAAALAKWADYLLTEHADNVVPLRA